MTHEHLETNAKTAAEAAIQTVTPNEARQIWGGNPALATILIGAVMSYYVWDAIDEAKKYDRTKKVDWKKLAKSVQDRL